MAVQAQYPSHLFFLDRNEQERKTTEYPLQAQAAGFVDQSALLFSTQPSNGGSSITNRKRGREAAAPAVAAAAMPNYAINLLSLQPQQQPQPPAAAVLNTNATTTATTTLIDLSLLQNQQPPPATFVSTGLRLSFGDSHHSQRPTQPQPQPQQGQGSSFLSSLLTEELAAQVKQQRDEINSYLQSQAEQLRQTLAESRRRHYRALLSLAEQSAARKMREKDAEMDRAARRNAELEKRVAQLRAETVAWQAKARAEEAAAAALQAQLHQAAQERRCAGDLGCSGGGGGADQAAAADDAESAYVDPERREPPAAAAGSTMVCRACRGRVVAVLLLPCRHLCLCRECGAAAEACPVCLCARTACLEVFLSLGTRRRQLPPPCPPRRD